jgi:galactokinase
MDQMASAVGGLVTIDFADADAPKVQQVDFDFSACGYALCIIDTGADHADLTPEYGAIPAEMGKIANYFCKKVLSEVLEEKVYAALPALR